MLLLDLLNLRSALAIVDGCRYNFEFLSDEDVIIDFVAVHDLIYLFLHLLLLLLEVTFT